MNPPSPRHDLLRVAVVGHTNAGKTSLLRTLMRDVRFGEVSDRPGTTREVEGCFLMVDGRPALELYDTPGLEDSIALLELLHAQRVHRRMDGIDLIHGFLESEAAHGRFAQEAKALRQMLECSAALYVIDARDPILAKYRDELEILGLCARPIVPVLNFIALPDERRSEWRDALARLNMHAVAEFDTVVFDAEGETRLFEKLCTLLDAHRGAIESLIEHRRAQRRELIEGSHALIADLLIDVAAHSVPVDLEELEKSSRPMDEMKDRVRQRERECVSRMLELHAFRPEDCVPHAVPVEGSAWPTDLFSPKALEEYGIGGASGAAAGAMVGLTLDILFHGLSLGAATSIGAAVGAALGAGRVPGKRLLERVTGRTNLQVDESTLHLLAARQMHLLEALLQRGHARIDPVELETPEAGQRSKDPLRRVVKMLRSGRGRGSWSRLQSTGAGGIIRMDDRRERLLRKVAEALDSARDRAG